jgi:hypothetical protein
MVADPFRMAFIRRLLVVAVLVAVTVGALSAMPGRAGAEQPGPISEHPWEITCIGATHAWETPDGGFNPAQVAFRARFTIVTDGVNRWFKEYPTVVTDPIMFPAEDACAARSRRSGRSDWSLVRTTGLPSASLFVVCE